MQRARNNLKRPEMIYKQARNNLQQARTNLKQPRVSKKRHEITYCEQETT